MAATQKSATGFKPYIPPVVKRLEERGGGPSTPASSLLHRMGKREVDEEVIAVVAWTVSHFEPRPHCNSMWDMGKAEKLAAKSKSKLMQAIEDELLDDLGLEWRHAPMGGTLLTPKAEYLMPQHGKLKERLANVAKAVEGLPPKGKK